MGALHTERMPADTNSSMYFLHMSEMFVSTHLAVWWFAGFLLEFSLTSLIGSLPGVLCLTKSSRLSPNAGEKSSSMCCFIMLHNISDVCS